MQWTEQSNDEDIDRVTGQKRLVVKDSDEKNQPRLELKNGNKTLKTYQMPIRANLLVQDGQVVQPGGVIAKVSERSSSPVTTVPSGSTTFRAVRTSTCRKMTASVPVSR